MNRICIPEHLKKMSTVFEQNGFEAFLVGGAIRDMVLGNQASDWDLATNANPQDVMRIFGRVIPTGIDHGTVTVLFGEKKIEVTTYRTESGYKDGRHPDVIQYAEKIEEDLSRRDFTMNALAASLKDGSIRDPFQGRKDIKNQIIRTVGSPIDRFSEDGLRPVRAIRFAAQLGFVLESETLAAIPLSREITKKISIERFRDEFCKMLASPLPSIALKLMESTGLLKMFLPELALCRGIEQKGFHIFDLLDHLFYSCDGAPGENLPVRLAALFHDIGKKEARQIDENGKYTFYGHENIGEKNIGPIMDNLRFPKHITAQVSHLIRHHMFHYEENCTDGAVRRFLSRVEAQDENGPILTKWSDSPNLVNLFTLRQADSYGTNLVKKSSQTKNDELFAFQERINILLAQKIILDRKKLDINGRDLLAAGFRGKALGYTLDQLMEAVLEDPSLNTKEKLLEIAKKIQDFSCYCQ